MSFNRGGTGIALPLCICILMLVSNVGLTQTTEPQNHWEKLSIRVLNMCPNQQHTFQIQVSDAIRAYPSIPGNLCELVTKNRMPSKTNYYELSKYVRIKILSEDELNAKGKSEKQIKPITHTSF